MVMATPNSSGCNDHGVFLYPVMYPDNTDCDDNNPGIHTGCVVKFLRPH